MADQPGTEQWSPRFRDIETWPTHAALAGLWEAQLAAVAAVGPALPLLGAAVEAAAARLSRGGRLAYAGAGTSARIGVQDGAELTPTFNWPQDRLVFLVAGGSKALTEAVEGAEDHATAAVQAIMECHLGPSDVLLGVAASGTTPYTVACATAARAAGALTIGIANVPGSALLQACDHPIPIPTGPEAIAGSTRLAAGTSQKVALNLFSTLLMVRLGRVHRGQMVDMQASNAKLRHRSVSMLQALTGRAEPDCAAALAGAEGHVKTALLLLHGLDQDSAAAALARHAGHLRPALDEL